MAKAKKIIRKTEKEALKERRKSGQLKKDKMEAREAGLSRKEARGRAKRLSRVQALKSRKEVRSTVAAKKKSDASVSKMFADRRRMEAKRGGQKLAYDVDKTAGRYQGSPEEVLGKVRKTSGSSGTKQKELYQRQLAANKKAEAKAKIGEVYEVFLKDGSKQKRRKSDPNKDYSKAKKGAKVKAIKKK